MRGITKRFRGTVALQDVNFEVRAGEIHGLIGENGAGKSTLMKILAGDCRADDGVIEIADQPIAIRDTRHARSLGVSMVYQELSLLPNLSVAENIGLGHEASRLSVIGDRSLHGQAERALERMSIRNVGADTRVGSLSLAEQQLVEIAKAVDQQARILVFDEPTAALTLDDCQRLLDTLRSLKEAGAAIVFVSHRYQEVLSVCDRCTVLRNGRTVTTADVEDLTLDRLVRLTIGEAAPVVTGSAPATQADSPAAETPERAPVLEVAHLAVGTKVSDVSFSVAAGEIVALCGLLGSGQNEVARAIYGDIPSRGTLYLDGEPVSLRSPRAATERGIGFLSESRRDEGIFPDLPARANVTIASLGRLRGGMPLISRRRERRLSDEVADRVGIAPEARAKSIKYLSGGNQQKALVARWLLKGSKVLICIEPTRGVDVGARQEIYEQLRGLARAGTALLIVTTEIDEAITLSDRILVLYEGWVMASMDGRKTTEQQIFMAMQGEQSPESVSHGHQ